MACSNGSPHVPDRCVYGYSGSFEDALKPLLLLYLLGSVMGTTLLAVLFQDCTRPFVVSTLLHLLPEVLVWTHLVFPPTHPILQQADNTANWRGRWFIRACYAVGTVVLLIGPVDQESGRVGPLVLKTYLQMAGTSDMLGLWLGLVMMIRRTHHGARRLGVVFFVHGAAFHLVAYEFCCLGDALGEPELQGFGWIVLLVATQAAFHSVIPLFREPLDLRTQAPNKWEKAFVVCGVLASQTVVPLLAFGGKEPDEVAIFAKAAFLPRDHRVLVAYKAIFPISTFLFIVKLLNAYVDARLPILPISNSSPMEHANGKSARKAG